MSKWRGILIVDEDTASLAGSVGERLGTQEASERHTDYITLQSNQRIFDHGYVSVIKLILSYQLEDCAFLLSSLSLSLLLPGEVSGYIYNR